jgi:hypothetical protein
LPETYSTSFFLGRATNVLSDLKLVYITWSKFQFLFRLV